MPNIDAEIYSEFKCKADKCNHSCCKGWEIDIDEDTLGYYKSLDSELGNEIRQNIHEGEDTFFKLTDDKRCPFLKDSGLCKIIEELGEDGLCDICRLHPRFFEDINDYSLAGVGLSCEKASELLFEKNSLNFIICDSQKTIGFQELLEMLDIDITQDYLKLTKIIPKYLNEAKIEEILDIFYITEPIDSNWKNEVLLIKRNYPDYLNNLDDNYIKKFELIYQYILFRQLELTLNHGVKKVVDYAIYSIIFIMLYANSFHDDIEAVRRWSEQIEYNEDNIDIILNSIYVD
ncbi:MAG: flagellin lysine-N-methylase [Eubacterium sp.]|nr:flagellin lysine-N-methylase [Eubacterium sp.]